MANSEHEIGYRRPPVHSRFKKGRSGNPKGRPKGSKNFVTELSDELRSPITVQEGGRTRKLPKQRVITKRLVHKALEGNEKALLVLFNMAWKMRTDGAENNSTPEVLEEDDKKILERALARRRKEVDEDVDCE